MQQVEVFMLFLGTSAADLLPNPLCNCPICAEARKEPRLQRFRSSFLLDRENLIDCGPDFGAAAMRYGIDLSELKNIFITHTHDDHFCPGNAGLFMMSQTRDPMPVNVFMSRMAFDNCQSIIERLKTEIIGSDWSSAIKKSMINLQPVEIGRPFTVGNFEVTAVNTTHRANQKETAINYRFRKKGLSLLYACDTGYYLEESLDILRDSALDVLIMEGTWGSVTTKPTDSHLNGFAFLEQLDTFEKYGIIGKDTKIYCTHINHKHSWNHRAYQQFFDNNAAHRVTVAYDGLYI